MRTITSALLYSFAVLLGVAACGESGAPDGGGGTSSGGASSGGGGGGDTAVGGTDAGGSASGGASSGGSESGAGGNAGAPGDGGQAGTGGTTPAGAHCAPGETQDIYAYLGTLSNCRRVIGGVGDDYDSARGITLEAPIGPGDVHAFSADMGPLIGTRTMEFWGASEDCGDGLELLATAVMSGGIRCVEFAPQNGTYSHVTWLWNGNGSHGDVTLCPEGSCGE